MELLESEELLLLFTGHPLIDHQHDGLLELVKTLRLAILAAQPEKEIRCLLAELEHQTREHFQTEEELMFLQHYPDLASHKAHHRTLMRCGAHLLGRQDALSVSGYEHILLELQQLALEHLKLHDMPLALFLQKKSRQ